MDFSIGIPFGEPPTSFSGILFIDHKKTLEENCFKGCFVGADGLFNRNPFGRSTASFRGILFIDYKKTLEENCFKGCFVGPDGLEPPTL